MPTSIKYKTLGFVLSYLSLDAAAGAAFFLFFEETTAARNRALPLRDLCRVPHRNFYAGDGLCVSPFQPVTSICFPISLVCPSSSSSGGGTHSENASLTKCASQ